MTCSQQPEANGPSIVSELVCSARHQGLSKVTGRQILQRRLVSCLSMSAQDAGDDADDRCVHRKTNDGGQFVPAVCVRGFFRSPLALIVHALIDRDTNNQLPQ